LGEWKGGKGDVEVEEKGGERWEKRGFK